MSSQIPKKADKILTMKFKFLWARVKIKNLTLT
jgi:hypothetical protein